MVSLQVFVYVDGDEEIWNTTSPVSEFLQRSLASPISSTEEEMKVILKTTIIIAVMKMLMIMMKRRVIISLFIDFLHKYKAKKFSWEGEFDYIDLIPVHTHTKARAHMRPIERQRGKNRGRFETITSTSNVSMSLLANPT